MLLLHFSALKTDLPGEIRRSAMFLDIPAQESRWDAIVEHCGFDYMKRHGAKIESLARRLLGRRRANIRPQGHERPLARHWFGVIAALIGTVLLLSSEFTKLAGSPLGTALMLCSASLLKPHSHGGCDREQSGFTASLDARADARIPS